MPRSIVPTFTQFLVLTAAQLNQYLRDNVNGLLKPPRAHFYRTSNQAAIPNITWTKVLFTTALYNEGLTWDSAGRVTVAEAGVYEVIGHVTLAAVVAASSVDLRLCVGPPAGAIEASYADNDFRAGLPASQLYAGKVAAQIQLALNQYVELWVRHDSGAARDLIIDAGASSPVATPRLTLAKVAEVV